MFSVSPSPVPSSVPRSQMSMWRMCLSDFGRKCLSSDLDVQHTFDISLTLVYSTLSIFGCHFFSSEYTHRRPHSSSLIPSYGLFCVKSESDQRSTGDGCRDVCNIIVEDVWNISPSLMDHAILSRGMKLTKTIANEEILLKFTSQGDHQK